MATPDISVDQSSVGATKSEIAASVDACGDRCTALLKQAEGSTGSWLGKAQAAFDSSVRDALVPHLKKINETLNEMGDRVGLAGETWMDADTDAGKAYSGADYA